MSRIKKTIDFKTFGWLLLAFALCSIIPATVASQNLEYVGSTLYSGGFKRIQIEGNYAYCGAPKSFQILSLEDPLNPQSMGGYPFITFLRDIFVSGDYAYITEGPPSTPYWRFKIVDISDPADMNLVSSISVGSYAYDIAVSSNFAFVTNGSNGILIIDVSDPLNPYIAEEYDTQGQATDISIANDTAYFVDYPSHFQILDISDPVNPLSVGIYNTLFSDAAEVCINGSYAYIGAGLFGGGYIEIVDITNPSSPEYRGHYDIGGSIRDVQAYNNFVYTTTHPESGTNYLVIDVSDPSEPSLSGSYLSDGLREIFLTPDYVYVAGYDPGLLIFETDNVSNPEPIAEYRGTGYIGYVTVSGNYAYVPEGNNGLWILDISNINQPVVAGLYEIEEGASGSFISGNYAYLPKPFAGLQIIDISDPSDPEFVGSYPADRFKSVFVEGDYAYVTESWEGFFILDISDPAEPALMGTCDIPGYGQDVFVQGDYAYIAASYDGGLQIVNIEDPFEPFIVGNHDTPGNAARIHVDGSYAYVADGLAGMQIYDISDPSAPLLAGTFDSPGRVKNVTIFGNYAAVADDSSGVEIIDISDPENPVYVTSYDTPGQAREVAVYGDNLLVADLYSLMILAFDPETGLLDETRISPEDFNILSAYPNPFNAQTTIKFSLSQSAVIKLEIFDITGRLVQTLADTEFPVGENAIVWDAEDHSSGVYFVRLSSSYGNSAKKLVLLK